MKGLTRETLKHEKWHTWHCVHGTPMREIARIEGVHPSTILRGIRRIEDLLDDERYLPMPMRPRPPTPEQEALAEVKAMINVHKYYKSAHLAPDHVAAAVRFKRNHQALRDEMPPTMWHILHHLIVEDGSVEQLETMEKLPQRSGKGVLRTLLTMMIEMEDNKQIEHKQDDTVVGDLREQVEYLTGNDPDVYLPFMTELGMTQTEARLITILLRANGKVVLKETLHRRLYGLRAVDEMPDLKIVDVLVCKARRRLEGTLYSIETVWGTGYKLAVEKCGDICHDEMAKGELA